MKDEMLGSYGKPEKRLRGRQQPRPDYDQHGADQDNSDQNNSDQSSAVTSLPHRLKPVPPSRVLPKANEVVTLKRRFGRIFVGGIPTCRLRLPPGRRDPGLRGGANRGQCDEDSTGPPQNVHTLICATAYSGFVVRGAFVVQLKNVGPGVTGKMEGSVEEVDSGNESQFHSEDELIAFLRECFARSCQRTSLNEGKR